MASPTFSASQWEHERVFSPEGSAKLPQASEWQSEAVVVSGWIFEATEPAG